MTNFKVKKRERFYCLPVKRKQASLTKPQITAISLVLFALMLSVNIVSASTESGEGSKGESYTFSKASPIECMRTHDVGNFVFGVSNFGRIGTGVKPFYDYNTGALVPQGEFPKASNTTYLYKGALWVGAVVNSDTLVSCGSYFNTPAKEMGSYSPIMYFSTLDPDAPEYDGAVSEQDYIAIYNDTIRNRNIKPLYLEITQRSYAWSYEYAEDFAIIEFDIENIGEDDLHGVYIGIYMDADVHTGGAGSDVNTDPPNDGLKGVTNGRDDLTGFLLDYPIQYGICEYYDTVGLAWTIDNNGDYVKGKGFGVPNITAVRILGDQFDIDRFSYNWWVWNYNSTYDYGPQKKENYQFLGNGLGTPIGDGSKYILMSNNEIDFGQPYTASITIGNPIWISAPEDTKYNLSRAGDCQCLISLGPFDITSGANIVLPVAYVAGEGFHYDKYNFTNYLEKEYRPDLFLENSDFSDLVNNAKTASFIYDNPGVDSDGDGYFGKSHICNIDSMLDEENEWVITVADTTYYEGDGIPDWKGAAPPPAPDFWVSPTMNGFRVRFNGYRSETTRDVFSGLYDFEGYHIYIGRDERETSYSLIASYDRSNYDKMVYNPNSQPSPRFELRDNPFTLQELRCLYGHTTDPCYDSTFDPLMYTPNHPYTHPLFPESTFYFVTHDYNNSEYGVTTPIRRIYPEAPAPANVMSLSSDQLTDDGYLKYYDYEFYIEDLLATVPYYINVTAFDFGSPKSGLAPMESSKLIGAICGYPSGSEGEMIGAAKEIYIYPNPFRIDANYRDRGLEGRTKEELPDDKVHQINFANLPNKCTIRIFSLDGDLVREITHDYPKSDPQSTHAIWDLVTRNRQLAVSGLYYWSVEDENGQVQIGKLVILF